MVAAQGVRKSHLVLAIRGIRSPASKQSQIIHSRHCHHYSPVHTDRKEDVAYPDIARGVGDRSRLYTSAQRVAARPLVSFLPARHEAH